MTGVPPLLQDRKPLWLNLHLAHPGASSRLAPRSCLQLRRPERLGTDDRVDAALVLRIQDSQCFTDTTRVIAKLNDKWLNVRADPRCYMPPDVVRTSLAELREGGPKTL